jgi:hypothetical protein
MVQPMNYVVKAVVQVTTNECLHGTQATTPAGATSLSLLAPQATRSTARGSSGNLSARQATEPSGRTST